MHDTILKNERLNLRLELEQYPDDVTNILVVKGNYDATGSYTCCTMEGCFSSPHDIPVTREEMDWLDSQEVEDWMDEVGY